MSKLSNVLIAAFIVVAAQAQMPHEVLLLVNKNSQPSLLAANTFADQYSVPKQNIVYLDIPESAYEKTATISPDEFTRLIWDPANAIARKRGVDQQILAWVYSVDFPIRVKTDTNVRRQLSVGGLTFVRNRIPGLSLVEDGKFHSKLFAGPNQRLTQPMPSLSLGIIKNGIGPDANLSEELAWLKDGRQEHMPLPSMMLGYIGENGTDMQVVLDTLIRGKQSRHKGARKGIYFVTSDDVRSTCREWQYAPVVDELKRTGVEAVITTNFPAGAENVFGVLAGAETLDPSSIASFMPGAMAEHLTSWSAEFQKPQTKATEWLKAGATGTAGSVVEPYSNPNKFPSARFYVHYAKGCTMLESFYQSIASPLQCLLLGDPLAKPYEPRFSVKVLGAERLAKDFTFMAQASSKIKEAQYLYSFLIDGQEVQKATDDPSFYLRLRDLSDGYHELRVVVRIKHLVEFNRTVIKPLMVDRMGRSVTISPEISKIGKYEHVIRANVGGEEQPQKLRLVCGELVLDEKNYTPDAALQLNEWKLGEGPNQIRVVAVYADGMQVSSAPVGFKIKFAP